MTESERAETETSEPVADRPETAAAPPPAAPRPRRRGLATAIVVLVVFLAGLAVWPLFGPLITGLLPQSWRGPEAAAGAEIEKRLLVLEGRLDRIAGKSGEETALRRALEGRLGKLDNRLDELSSAVEKADATAGEQETRLGALEQRGDELAERIETAARAEGGGDAKLEAVVARLAGVEAGLQAAAAEPAGLAQLRADLVAAETRLVKLETPAQAGAGLGQRQALILAVGQLRAALAAGRPYRVELDRLATFSGDDAEILTALEALDAGAAAGLATAATLGRRFEPLAGAIVQAGEKPPPEGWLARAGSRLAALVTVRRTGEIEGGSTDAIVARTERRLAEGALEAAVRELAQLQGAAAEVVGPWRRAAEARILADRSVDRLEARAIKLLGAG